MADLLCSRQPLGAARPVPTKAGHHKDGCQDDRARSQDCLAHCSFTSESQVR